MKKLLFTALLFLNLGTAYCQEVSPRISYSAQAIFQSFKIPVAGPEVYSRNKGLSISGYYNLAGKPAFQQQLELGYFFNRYHGSSYFIATSTSYNPICKGITVGIGLGAGYMNTGFREGGWEQNENGEWISTSNRKGCFYVPADLHLRVKAFETEKIKVAPMLIYQVNALVNYSHAATILPQSMLKAGIHLSFKKP